MDGANCGGFEGNPDFYGLGIRLGVYLQVLSSWATNTLKDDAIADTHAANSIFLLAIVVSVLSATASQEIRPVEVWLMLQICLMFPLTVMSIFGVRTNFLTPENVDSLVERFVALSTSVNVELDLVPGAMIPGLAGIMDGIVETRFEATLEQEVSPADHPGEIIVEDELKVRQTIRKAPAGDFDARFTLRMGFLPDFSLSFKALSLMKHFTLTWISSIWRALIVGAVAATNLWFWFWVSNETSCSYSIFILARRNPAGSLGTFFKVGAVILGAVTAIPLLLVALFTLSLANYVADHVRRLRALLPFSFSPWLV